jgi:hypothetical protein
MEAREKTEKGSRGGTNETDLEALFSNARAFDARRFFEKRQKIERIDYYERVWVD